MGYLVWTIKDFVNIFKKWQENEFDGLVIIDGNRGLGKSTLAYKFARRFKQFNPYNDLLYSREDIMNALAKKKNHIVIADEMINVTYNRDFYDREQKKLLKMLNVYRDSKNILISCVPNFFDLDKQYRTLAKMRIQVVRRGLAIIHTKNQSSYSTDPWDQKVNQKIEASWIKRSVFKPRYNRLTTFRGIIRYGKLSEEAEELYRSIKKEKRGHIFETEMNGNNGKNESTTQFIARKLMEGEVIDNEKIKVLCDIRGEKFSSVYTGVCKLLKDKNSPLTLSKLIKKNEEDKQMEVKESTIAVRPTI